MVGARYENPANQLRMVPVNLSFRTRLSLAQCLAVFRRQELALLLPKHGIASQDLEYGLTPEYLPDLLKDTLVESEPEQLGGLLEEIARTRGAIRATLSPKYPFDERWRDLQLCLELDGYVIERNDYGTELDRFVAVEPVIVGAAPERDDLTLELDRSRLSDATDIRRLVEDSAAAFRREDFNACLAESRVALETLARSIAIARQKLRPGAFDPAKWGQVITYLRTSVFLDASEEHGLTGVYSLISRGSHMPLGFTDREFARFGRSLALSACYFLTKRVNAG